MNYIRLLCFGLCSFLIVGCVAQKETGISIIHVDTIPQIDWRQYDYASLKTIVQNVQVKDILILSEADHGHGNSIDAKTMILKALIDSSIIQSLYLESNWMNCERIMQILRLKGTSGIKEAEQFFQTYDLIYWKANGFWEYIASKIIAGKLTLRGIDVAALSPIIADELFSESLGTEFSREFSLKYPNDFQQVKASFDFFEGWKVASYYTKDAYEKMKSYINGVINYFHFNNEYVKAEKWESILSFFYWMYKRSEGLAGNRYSNVIKNERQNSIFHAVRDSIMASIFLKQYSKDSANRIACSVSAYHALRNSLAIDEIEECCKDRFVETMGEIIDRKVGDKVYSICFITASGRYGIDEFGANEGAKVLKPKRGSLEHTLSQGSFDYCFIDLNSLNGKSFFMNAVFNKYLKSEWRKNYSGVFLRK